MQEGACFVYTYFVKSIILSIKLAYKSSMKYLKKEEQPVVQALYKRKLLTKKSILLLSFVLTLVFMLFFLAASRTYLERSGEIYATANSTVYSDFIISSTGPNYFFPNAEVHVIFRNSYGNALQNVSAWMSLDNSTWVQVPFSNGENDVMIGITPLNGFSTTVYSRIYCTDSNVIVGNQSMHTTDLLYTSTFHLYFVSILTPQSLVVLFLVAIAIFSFLVQILEFLKNK